MNWLFRRLGWRLGGWWALRGLAALPKDYRGRGRERELLRDLFGQVGAKLKKWQGN